MTGNNISIPILPPDEKERTLTENGAKCLTELRCEKTEGEDLLQF